MRTVRPKGPKGRADRLFSLIVRSRGICQRCGSTNEGELQCAHIVSRRFSATRCDERNAWSLCAGCHMRLTLHPDEHMELVRSTIGMAAFRRLKNKAERPAKVDWAAEARRLADRLKVVAA